MEMEDPELFMRPDGHPMVFIMGHGKSSCEETRSEIKKDVELRGGLVLDAVDARYKDHCIYLLGKNETPKRTSKTNGPQNKLVRKTKNEFDRPRIT